MYGMVNKVIRQILVEDYGDSLWQEILLQDSTFAGKIYELDQFTDAATYNIIHYTSKLLEISAEKLLIHLGERWIEVTTNGDYQEYYQLGGSDLFTFLSNLDRMHESLGKIFTQLSPPTFELQRESVKQAHLIYRSHRQGLEPFVLGLLQGLSKYFDQPAEVRHLPELSGEGHQFFAITLLYECTP